jgi:hypothetical protein
MRKWILVLILRIFILYQTLVYVSFLKDGFDSINWDWEFKVWLCSMKEEGRSERVYELEYLKGSEKVEE